ncbi:bcl-2-related ovarian killer protein isoform X1 [Alligator sinensis]|uniref:Bcl-2-related ovarian killer protein isoform X1 n=1 Tax=Alligator sinensis TaxID=38654 RepID=A0A1U8DSV4_ALLSI|nr:bcl-2-related ovarian killer protein isoform X1 [Alligator sinensis]
MEVLRRSSVFAAEVMEVFDRSPTDKELVSQAKVLCRDYIHSRLIRVGIGWSKPEYSAPFPGGKLAEVSSILLRLGDELEHIRPNLYRNIARQLNISLHSETVVTDAFLAVGAQIFTAGITWGKVASLYAVAAGLAVDCVRHAQPAMVHTIVDCLGEFVRKTLVTWLKRRGGWVRGADTSQTCLKLGKNVGDVICVNENKSNPLASTEQGCPSQLCQNALVLTCRNPACTSTNLNTAVLYPSLLPCTDSGYS